MNKFAFELERLYGHAPADASPPTRALVMEFSQAASEHLMPVWRGVQSAWDLPAPAIAVSGEDALQLWFSLAAEVPPSRGMRFLRGLHQHFMPEVPRPQVRMLAGASELPAVPCLEVAPHRWSAFVRHDLASLFAETPWLDMPPNLEGQAAILGSLQPMGSAAFEAMLDRLGAGDASAAPAASAAPPAGETVRDARPADPARFLAEVMNDEAAPLALRIEAARILLLDARRG